MLFWKHPPSPVRAEQLNAPFAVPAGKSCGRLFEWESTQGKAIPNRLRLRHSTADRATKVASRICVPLRLEAIKDTQLRGILLQAFYERRRGHLFLPKVEKFGVAVTEQDILQACD